jgi:D-alanyl-lipoteichoic acid acyltransferase DltB (MBOAT superfamily)
MQFFNMLGVAAALRLSWGAGWGLPGVWHCLTLFFVLRILYHAIHIFNNRKTHVRKHTARRLRLPACFQRLQCCIRIQVAYCLAVSLLQPFL